MPMIDVYAAEITESPEGGWGLQGHANTGADIVAAARRALAGK
jgi:hypothetical protein